MDTDPEWNLESGYTFFAFETGFEFSEKNGFGSDMVYIECKVHVCCK